MPLLSPSLRTMNRSNRGVLKIQAMPLAVVLFMGSQTQILRCLFPLKMGYFLPRWMA